MHEGTQVSKQRPQLTLPSLSKGEHIKRCVTYTWYSGWPSQCTGKIKLWWQNHNSDNLRGWWLGRDTKEFSLLIELFYLLIRLVVRWVYEFVKMCWTVHLKYMHVILCKLCLNEKFSQSKQTKQASKDGKKKYKIQELGSKSGWIQMKFFRHHFAVVKFVLCSHEQIASGFRAECSAF